MCACILCRRDMKAWMHGMHVYDACVHSTYAYYAACIICVHTMHGNDRVLGRQTLRCTIVEHVSKIPPDTWEFYKHLVSWMALSNWQWYYECIVCMHAMYAMYALYAMHACLICYACYVCCVRVLCMLRTLCMHAMYAMYATHACFIPYACYACYVCYVRSVRSACMLRMLCMYERYVPSTRCNDSRAPEAKAPKHPMQRLPSTRRIQAHLGTWEFDSMFVCMRMHA